MVTKEDLQAKYAGLSNQALMAILEHKADYTELAIEVATKELESRKITPADIRSYEKEKADKVTISYENAIVDLPAWQKVMYYIPIIGGFIRRAYRMNFNEDGSLLKIKQAAYFTYTGWATILVIIFAETVGASDIVCIAIWVCCYIPVYLYNESSYKPKQLIKINQQFGV